VTSGLRENSVICSCFQSEASLELKKLSPKAAVEWRESESWSSDLATSEQIIDDMAAWL